MSEPKGDGPPAADSVAAEPTAGGTVPTRETYAGAGVDIDAGQTAVARIKDHVRSTFRPEVIGDIGGFGGLFQFPSHRFEHPVLISSTDGVGTKAMVAQRAGRFETIGVDLVAMCVDDIACAGAEPLFFLDYIAVGSLDPDHIDQLVSGVATGCREAGCALVGGEMAEHPGAMEPGEFDLVGFAVGVAERDRILDGSTVRQGDAVIGLPSRNLRSNGYSLARRVFFDVAGRALDDPPYEGAHHTLADELLAPSVIYSPAIASLLRVVDVRAIAHITGGGIPGNLHRVLSGKLDAVVDRDTWEPPRVFSEIQALGRITDAEMARVFNMGVGMAVVVPDSDVHTALDVLRTAGHRATQIGVIERGEGKVRYAGRSAS